MLGSPSHTGSRGLWQDVDGIPHEEAEKQIRKYEIMTVAGQMMMET